MARFPLLAGIASLALISTSCKQDNSEIVERLDQVIAKLDAIKNRQRDKAACRKKSPGRRQSSAPKTQRSLFGFD